MALISINSDDVKFKGHRTAVKRTPPHLWDPSQMTPGLQNEDGKQFPEQWE